MSKKRIRAVKVVHPCAWAAKSSSEPRKYYTWELPATSDAYEQMVEQMARGIASVWATSDPDIEHSVWKREARAALRAIGIKPPKKGRT